jgi:serine/threonine-protein kinase HipA
VSERILHILMHDTNAGVVIQNRSGAYRLEYDQRYQEAYASRLPGSMPLSLSLPLTTATHGNRPVRAYLQGLLPDSTVTLQAWAERFKVSARNPFALLEHVGEECAGAVRFVRPERMKAATEGKVTPLSDTDVEALIEQLRHDLTAAPVPSVAQGQFSLAGAQSKFSLLRTASGWARATGR